MQIAVPPLTEPVLLTDYHPAMLLPGTSDPVVVHVWINPPRAVLAEYGAWIKAFETAKAQYESAAAKGPGRVGGKRAGKGGAGRAALDAAQAAMRAADNAIAGWYARAWSMSADISAHWTVDDVLALAAQETDPALYTWLCKRTWDALREHRAGRKKVSASR